MSKQISDTVTKGVDGRVILVNHSKMFRITGLMWDLVNLVVQTQTSLRSHEKFQGGTKVHMSFQTLGDVSHMTESLMFYLNH